MEEFQFFNQVGELPKFRPLIFQFIELKEVVDPRIYQQKSQKLQLKWLNCKKLLV